jgi:hypothetical protein
MNDLRVFIFVFVLKRVLQKHLTLGFKHVQAKCEIILVVLYVVNGRFTRICAGEPTLLKIID